MWTPANSKGRESLKIRWEIVPYTRGEGLDLGCGEEKAFPHFVGVDNGHHERFGYTIKPDVLVKDCSKLEKYAAQSWDFVFSSHLLEHIEDHKAALREWWRVLKPGGYLVLYLPHADYYPNIDDGGEWKKFVKEHIEKIGRGLNAMEEELLAKKLAHERGLKGETNVGRLYAGTPFCNADHKHDFRPEDIICAMKEINGWDLVENQLRTADTEYSFFQVYRKLKSWNHRSPHLESWKNPKPTKTAAVVRYGAFGDLMQASSVIKGLKDEGFHVTLYSSPPGSDVILHDPNIDQIILQDKDQVPNLNLGDFWDHIKKKYDRFVNLSESVEGTFLALPARIQHGWPHELRHKMLNVNYVEFQHELAQVPHKPQIKFYATDEERAWAKKQRAKMGDYVIVWSLAGSSVHKAWPYVDNVVARILIEYPNASIVMVGGPECEMLQAGWTKEPRIIKTCGKWSIRESLSFLEQADIVIGPETGVLNAAACMPMRKVVLLSHSSVENLTRDWVNTVSLTPAGTKCWPCHQLHYNWNHCHQSADAKCEACNENEKKLGARACQIHTGTAQCQTDISPSLMWDAVRVYLDERREAA